MVYKHASPNSLRPCKFHFFKMFSSSSNLKTFEPMRPLPEPSHAIPWTVPALVQAATFAHQARNWV